MIQQIHKIAEKYFYQCPKCNFQFHNHRKTLVILNIKCPKCKDAIMESMSTITYRKESSEKSLRVFEVYCEHQTKCDFCNKIIHKKDVLVLCYESNKLIWKRCCNCYLEDKNGKNS